MLGILMAGAVVARAHDPYEITSVVNIQSNRIELFVEMEFPTGMTLAGQTTSREGAPASQFEAARPALEQLAGGLFDFTAGNHALLALRTNVVLGVEDHIQCKVEYAPTDYRPLRLVPRGLRGLSDSGYGISLTVLDMVNQKVLGQTTLFADSIAAEFPPDLTGAKSNLVAAPILALNEAVKAPLPAAPLASPRAMAKPRPSESRHRGWVMVAFVLVIGLGFGTLVWARGRS
jgi:hypothetical protein